MPARSLLLALIMTVHPGNNGRFFLSEKDAAAMMGARDRKVASRALKELCDHQLLIMQQDSKFNWKAPLDDQRKARVWRATWLIVLWTQPNKRQAASQEFRSWRPAPNTPAAARFEAAQEHTKRRSTKKSAGCFKGFEPTISPIVGGFKGHLHTPPIDENVTIVRDFKCPLNGHHTNNHGDGDSGVIARSIPASASRIAALRNHAIAWLADDPARTQKELAIASGIDPAKLSRVLNDRTGRRFFTDEQASRLLAVIEGSPSTDCERVNPIPTLTQLNPANSGLNQKRISA